MTQTFIIRDDKIRDRATDYLEKMSLLPLSEVVIRPYKSSRSTEANARLWALHQAASTHTGYSPEELHEFCKSRFLGTTRVEVKDTILEVPISSAKLGVSDFSNFMQQVEAFYASELGVMIEQEAYG